MLGSLASTAAEITSPDCSPIFVKAATVELDSQSLASVHSHLHKLKSLQPLYSTDLLQKPWSSQTAAASHEHCDPSHYRLLGIVPDQSKFVLASVADWVASAPEMPMLPPQKLSIAPIELVLSTSAESKDFVIDAHLPSSMDSRIGCRVPAGSTRWKAVRCIMVVIRIEAGLFQVNADNCASDCCITDLVP